MRPLSPRQLEILTLLAHGLPYKVIAELLGITESCVKQTAHLAYERLGATDKVTAFLALGWLRVPDSQDPERLDGWTRRMLGS